MDSNDYEPASITGKKVTRRDFLKVAGVAGAAVGLTGGAGGILAACGSSDDSGGSSASPGGTGREIKVGFVSPLTGPLAAFGEADQFCVDQWNAAVKDGVECGDGQTHPITIIMKDSQSDTNRAAQVAGDLITNDGVDIMMVTSTPDTVNPVADQCEALADAVRVERLPSGGLLRRPRRRRPSLPAHSSGPTTPSGASRTSPTSS